MDRLFILLCYATSFLAAFLLFTLQPMASKAILPILGGTPAVWNTAMVCFQMLLLGGYIYAHLLGKLRSIRAQALIHAVFWGATFLVWPLTPADFTVTATPGHPIRWVLTLLITTIGLPFLFVSATAPLLQRWVSAGTSSLAATPYRLYSASNAGSFAALILYLVLIEPRFAFPEQLHGWSLAFLCFAAMLLCIGIATHARPRPAELAAPASPKPSLSTQCQWLWLAFLPSSLMLGVTTYISTDIAAIPLLWIIPITFYLLSFVSAFSARPVAVRTASLLPSLVLLAAILYALALHSITWLFFFHLLAFAIVCFALHGALAARAPATAHLTRFYVILAIGGALGGIFNALLAPMLFNGIMEYPMALALSAATMLSLRATPLRNVARAAAIGAVSAIAVILCVALFPILSSASGMLFLGLLIGLAAARIGGGELRKHWVYIAMCISLADMFVGGCQLMFRDKPLFSERNFYGTVSVLTSPAPLRHILLYNTTDHGSQLRTAKGRTQLLTYYAALSDIAKAESPRGELGRKAVIGLGSGNMKCILAPSEHMDFYEINPVIETIAENPGYFSFLRDCPGTHRIVLGDGRLTLATAPAASYDTIFIDAFSSDAIPTHLLTTEAIAIYKEKLRPGGLLMFHISNRHTDLAPLLALQAETVGAHGFLRHFIPKPGTPFASPSTWYAMSFDKTPPAFFTMPANGWKTIEPLPRARAWTDQFSNILPYLTLFSR